MATNSLQRKTSREDLDKLDRLVAETGLSLSKMSSGSITEAVMMADAMDVMRSAFTDDMMESFMKLMNTPLGFKTDRDPAKCKKNAQGQPVDNRGNVVTPYPKEVVRDCIIEALLRGLKIVGNHFNIIAGTCYTTKEGYFFLIKKVDGLQDFSPMIGAPRKGDIGTYCQCKAKWRIKGQEFSIGYETNDAVTIPVRVDEWTTGDAVLGKATRKFLKRVYEKITGVDLPDGEVGDDIIPPNAEVKQAATSAPGTAQEKPVSEVKQNREVPKHEDLHAEVMKRVSEAKITEDQVVGYLKSVRKCKLSTVEIFQLTEATLIEVLENWATLLPEFQKFEV